MKKRTVPTLVLALVLVGEVGAQDLDLTLDGAVNLTLAHNLTLKAGDLQLRIKERTRDSSWNAFIPKTSVNASLSHLNQGASNPFAALKGLGFPAEMTGDIPNTAILATSFSAELNLSLALFDGIRHTVLDYEAGRIEADTARRMVVRDTKKAFYQLLLMRENQTSARAQLETARKRFEQEKRNFEAGVGSEFTMLSAQVGYENLKPQIDEMAVVAAVAELGFRSLMGVGGTGTLTLRGSFDLGTKALDHDPLVASAVARNGALASLRQAVEVQKNLRQAKANLAYLPVLGLRYTADPTFQKDPLKDALFAPGAEDWKMRSGMVSAYVSLPLDSLLPFSGTGVELANLDDATAALQVRLDQATRATQDQVTGLILQVAKSRRAVERLDLNVTLAARAAQMAEKGYESGAYELLQVEDSENKLREARLGVLSEKYAFLSGLFDLEFETNQTLTE